MKNISGTAQNIVSIFSIFAFAMMSFFPTAFVMAESGNTAPSLQGVADTTITICDDNFDPLEGVTATDEDGDTVQISVEGDNVLADGLTNDEDGEYSLTYTADDGNGGFDILTRVVTVEECGNTAPSLQGVADIEISVCDDFDVMEGVTATDEDGDTIQISTEGDNVLQDGLDNGEAGKYSVTYTADDGNEGFDIVDRMITVTEADCGGGEEKGNTAPSLQGVADTTITICDDNFDPLEGVTATDEDGDTVQISVEGDNVLADGLTNDEDGEYSLTYTADDGNGGFDIVPIVVTVDVADCGGNQAPIAQDDSKTVDENSVSNLIDVLSNDSDPDGDDISIKGVADPANGSATIKVNLTTQEEFVEYTPDTDFVGTDTFTYTIEDEQGKMAIADITVTVEEEGEPVTSECTLVTQEGRTVVEFYAGTGEKLRSDRGENRAHTSSKSVSLNPGTYEVTLETFDGYTGRSNTNQPDESWSVQFLAGDAIVFDSGATTDLADNVDFVKTTEVVNDGIELTTNITEVVGRHAAYPDNSNPNSVTPVCAAFDLISDQEENQAPIANPDEVTTDEDTSVLIDVLSNDSDPDGDAITLINVGSNQAPQNGTAVIEADQVRYTPNSDFVGTDTFSYTIEDPSGSTASAVVTVTVEEKTTPVTDECTLESMEDRTILDFGDNRLRSDKGENQAKTDKEDLPLSAGKYQVTLQTFDGYDGRSNANQPNESWFVKLFSSDDSLVIASQTSTDLADDVDFVKTTDVVNEELEITTDVASVQGYHSVYPDGSSANSLVAVCAAFDLISDQEENQAPIANPDEVTTDEDTSVLIDVLSNDSDPDGDAITLINVGSNQAPQNGTAVIEADQVRYTPNSDFVGTDTFSYTIEDPSGSTASAVVTVTVEEDDNGGGGGTSNQAPDAVDDEVTTDVNTNVTIDVLANDSDPEGDSLTIVSVSAPDNGEAVIDEGEITYTPDEDFEGTDTFTYTIEDSEGKSDSATVTVTVRKDDNDGGGSGGGSGGVAEPRDDDSGQSQRRVTQDNDERPEPRILGEETPTPQCNYLRDYLRVDFNNDPIEVMKLQAFLRSFEGFTNLEVDGEFDQEVFQAVSAFQTRYSDDILNPWGYQNNESTGYVYILTKKKVNEIFCDRLFPLDENEVQEIEGFESLLNSLRGSGVTISSTGRVLTSSTFGQGGSELPTNGQGDGKGQTDGSDVSPGEGVDMSDRADDSAQEGDTTDQVAEDDEETSRDSQASLGALTGEGDINITDVIMYLLFFILGLIVGNIATEVYHNRKGKGGDKSGGVIALAGKQDEHPKEQSADKGGNTVSKTQESVSSTDDKASSNNRNNSNQSGNQSQNNQNRSQHTNQSSKNNNDRQSASNRSDRNQSRQSSGSNTDKQNKSQLGTDKNRNN